MGSDRCADAGALSRRGFVRGAMATGLFAAMSGGSVARADPSATDFTELDSSITGDVIVPGDTTRFGSTKAIVNTRYDDTAPYAVATPRSTDDVARIMSFARRNHVSVAVRSGGHSYVGASSATGSLVVDLRGLPGPTTYDESTQTVTVTPATGLYDLRSTLLRSGRSIPTGTCPTVGIGGLTLGGGIGVDSRERGLTCDTLTSATVVVPGGDVVSVSPGHHDDLLWALRGGAGGVGVVTSMTFATHAAANKDLVLLGFPGDATADVLATWSQWMPTVARSNWVGANVESDRRGDLRCGVLFVTPDGTGPRLAADFATAVGTQPNFDASATLRPEEVLLRLAGGAPTSPRHGFTAGSDVVGAIGPDTAEAIVAVIRSRSAAGAAGSVIIDPIDGAVHDVRPSASAFPWRRHRAVLQWFVDVDPGDPYGPATAWVAQAHQAVGMNSVGAYVNYAEPGVSQGRYFGRNLTRLSTTRAAYDPDTIIYASTDGGDARTDSSAPLAGGG